MSYAASQYTHLLLVCCHAVFTREHEWRDENAWLLKDFQKSNASTGKLGEHHTFVAHILTAAFAAIANPNALIIFSGGQTTDHPRTEAEGYGHVLSDLVAKYQLPNLPCETENLATDSYQNLLFSILKFKNVTGNYPKNITIFTHAFKNKRFLECHVPALKWPSNRVQVQGINPPFTLNELQEVERFEHLRAYRAFKEENLYGRAAALAQKQLDRNWDPEALHRLTVDLEQSVQDLVHWTGGSTGLEIFPHMLPWEQDQ
ncbi:Hypothetical protein R9X50_00464700 [Acrodontium crateriforme]|uniref:DUF218 domain-containing protein n=1 Tax=Acrodontium crateriforme TaxID=150365 RepID=A0AAQ3M5R0_9PEZI|nr:Hypothetical protein R9X50_00464700 [Acrodontium crateriforme]